MSDELLPYYQSELRFIRRMGAQFAAAHPRIAGRLGLQTEGTDDPHVARLIEAFAYLNARTQHKLADDLPEITDALLGVLYPHYLRPIPSMAIVAMTLERGQAELTAGYHVPRHEEIETAPIRELGEPCRFRTCYPLTLWPIEVKQASLKGHPFQAPSSRLVQPAVAALRVALECWSPQVAFANLKLNRLRFFLSGDSKFTFDLYELLLNNALRVAVANSPEDRDAAFLEPSCIHPVGFERDEGMIDYPAHAFLGYRLLTEYFAFPEKFLFVDFELPASALRKIGRRLELFVYFDQRRPELEPSVDASMLRLGCCPIVNLFRQRAEPIRLTHYTPEYHVVPDARRPLAREVYSIDRVTAATPEGSTVEYRPFYSLGHGDEAAPQRTFWHAARRPAPPKSDGVDEGTEIYLSLVDLDFSPWEGAEGTLDVETTCTNRDLPTAIRRAGVDPEWRLAEGGPLGQIRGLSGPTATLRPPLRHGARWRLLSHLTLNHITLSDGADGAEALREILALYDFAEAEETRRTIEGLESVQCRRVVRRVGGPIAAGLCRGLEVTLHFNEDRYSGGGVFLFASVLERFLSLYCSINSFTQTVATTNRRDGVLHRWPPRAGEKTLL